MSIIVDIILITIIVTTFNALKLSELAIIGGIEDASQKKVLYRSVLTIVALLFAQWQMFGFFGAAPFAGISLLLYLVIFYEVIGIAAMLFFREGYVQLLKNTSQKLPLVIKIPVAGELVLFCYLFVRDILILL